MICAQSSLYVNMQQQYDEKNIRRRVYDALNVLMAMDIISKDKKEIQWKGLPRTSISDIEELKVVFTLNNAFWHLICLCYFYPLLYHFLQKEVVGLKGRIEKKSAYLQELQDQVRMWHQFPLPTSASCSCNLYIIYMAQPLEQKSCWYCILCFIVALPQLKSQWRTNTCSCVHP